ncbi:hypothetical protein JK386_07470 [Nocardioides sp. zg-536]|uniref:Uncharacterized protein n=1 Tax=Nocardioides faecalis TaxID=2803858 RepID=A0A938Y9J2_9ACTN|nr:hypothetical protein [Nocardioides faecalis]MBM9459739.1 hypothetical protein [Nocardioides faecalis]MBS4753484.1 hypothetical protein [Nocardioides faecalis]QVI58256.1 hypothetical protein KG111_14765 [Nocardioides faecalis]
MSPRPPALRPPVGNAPSTSVSTTTPSLSRRPRRTGTFGRFLAAAAVVALTLAGCGDADVEPGEPQTSTTSAGAAASPEESPTAATPEVVPASGMELQTKDAVRVHAPETGGKWYAVGDGTRTVTAATNIDAGPVELTLAEFPTSSTDFEDIAVVDVETYGEFKDGAGIARGDDREVRGLSGWVLTGADDEYTYYRFGTIHAGVFVTVSLVLPKDLPDAEADALVESVLASVEWK